MGEGLEVPKLLQFTDIFYDFFNFWELQENIYHEPLDHALDV